MTRFILRPSRYLTIVRSVAHVAAAALVLALHLPAAVMMVLCALVVASFAHALLRHALLLTPHAIVAGRLAGSAEATLERRDGRAIEADILGTTYVTPLLTVLNVRERSARAVRHIVLVPDNIDAEAFRRLRVLLRWSRDRSATKSQAREPRGVL